MGRLLILSDANHKPYFCNIVKQDVIVIKYYEKDFSN